MSCFPVDTHETLRGKIEHVQNLSSELAEQTCAAVMTTTPQCLQIFAKHLCFSYLGKGLGTSLQIFDILKEWLKKISVMVITNWKCFTCYLLGYGNFEVL